MVIRTEMKALRMLVTSSCPASAAPIHAYSSISQPHLFSHMYVSELRSARSNSAKLHAKEVLIWARANGAPEFVRIEEESFEETH